MRRTTTVACISGAALAAGCVVAPALAATPRHWSKATCVARQALFDVRHPHPTAQQLRMANGMLARHGCTQRVPGGKRWSKQLCADYVATFAKLYAFASNRQLMAANRALEHHACRPRVRRL